MEQYTDDRAAVVMGAGPGGLATGYWLAKHGVPVTVLERAPVVGGLARTVQRDGFRFDLGGHRWFSKVDEVNDFYKEVIADETIWVRRVSRIYFDGKYIDYPLAIGNALSAIGPALAAKAVLDYGRVALERKRNPKPIVSMEDAYIDQYGETLYKLFFERYSEKVWGRPCSEMSGDWVSQRTKGMSLLTAVKDALIPSNGAVQSLIESFMYPRYGYGRLSERMAEGIEAAGNDVRLGAGVSKVLRQGQHITGVGIGHENGLDEIVEGSHFVSSIPLTVLCKIMEPAAPAEVIAAADALTFRNVITVNLMLDRQQVTPDTWLYVHDRSIKFGRLHEPKNWSVDMVPDQSKTSIVAEYFCSFGDEIWNMSGDGLVELTAKHLSDDLGFINRNEVLGGFAVRCPRAYPSYTSGYEEPLEILKSFVNSFDNLQIIGRYGTFRYNNADHSVETGLLAAKNILGEHHDLEQVNAEKEYHEIKRLDRAPVAAAHGQGKDRLVATGSNGRHSAPAPAAPPSAPLNVPVPSELTGAPAEQAGDAPADD
jgi:protoporphyrinogen oxidase